MLIESWTAVAQFEQRIAEYAGASYAVAVDTCTAALFLCCKRLKVGRVTLPRYTYVGVPMAVLHAGGKVDFEPVFWSGQYHLKPYPIVDSACRLSRGMYKAGELCCLSFQYKKHLPIGRGGMILTDSTEHAEWFRAARFNGKPHTSSPPAFLGWHCYMEPERAARGLVLADNLPDHNADLVNSYPDLSTYEVFREHSPDR